jgi:two-component system chemotaxis response regulator CheB
MAIAVVQHRAADGESRLAHLLGARSPLPVCEVDDMTTVTANNVYLAPAGYHLLVDNGRFALSVDEPVCYARPSIDVLFESAADAYGERLVGIVLTGASEDGAAGLVRIKAAGGLAIVQDPNEALSPVAPRAAIARTAVDYVLGAAAIGPLLVRLGRTRREAERAG